MYTNFVKLIACSQEAGYRPQPVVLLEAKIRQLERIVGQKTGDIEILNEAIRIGRKKTDLAATLGLLEARVPLAKPRLQILIERCLRTHPIAPFFVSSKLATAN